MTVTVNFVTICFFCDTTNFQIGTTFLEPQSLPPLRLDVKKGQQTFHLSLEDRHIKILVIRETI